MTDKQDKKGTFITGKVKQKYSKIKQPPPKQLRQQNKSTLTFVRGNLWYETVRYFVYFISCIRTEILFLL